MSFIVQKECPYSTNSRSKADRAGNKILMPCLQHLEITCPSFPKACFSFTIANAPNLKTAKVFHIPGLRRQDFDEWVQHSLQKLETLIIFKAQEMNKEAVELLMDSLPNLQRLGDFHSFDIRRPHDMRRFMSKIRDESWNLSLIESPPPHSDEKDFNRQLSLHWFYLTNENQSLKMNHQSS